jgi:large subunit ribosomal protein L22
VESKAIARYVRISPRKMQIVADLVRGKDVEEALAILKYTPKRGAPVMEKLLNSAIANAENNYEMNRDALYVAQVYANQGPTMKRFRPRAQGRAFTIRKRTSHVGIVLKERS